MSFNTLLLGPLAAPPTLAITVTAISMPMLEGMIAVTLATMIAAMIAVRFVTMIAAMIAMILAAMTATTATAKTTGILAARTAVMSAVTINAKIDRATGMRRGPPTGIKSIGSALRSKTMPMFSRLRAAETPRLLPQHPTPTIPMSIKAPTGVTPVIAHFRQSTSETNTTNITTPSQRLLCNVRKLNSQQPMPSIAGHAGIAARLSPYRQGSLSTWRKHIPLERPQLALTMALSAPLPLELSKVMKVS